MQYLLNITCVFAYMPKDGFASGDTWAITI